MCVCGHFAHYFQLMASPGEAGTDVLSRNEIAIPPHWFVQLKNVLKFDRSSNRMEPIQEGSRKELNEWRKWFLLSVSILCTTEEETEAGHVSRRPCPPVQRPCGG